MNAKELLETLKGQLSPLYTQPIATGGHDLPHVVRVAEMYPQIRFLVPDVNETLYQIAAWLHNIDRVPHLQKGAIRLRGLKAVLYEYLNPSDLTAEDKSFVVDAVLQHSKKKDEPDDSPLLRALRIADKWSRIDVLGITSGIAWLGGELPLYHIEKPFVYGSTAEGEWKTHYGNFFRIIEWYAMYKDIRKLVARNPYGFREILFFVRAWGRAIAAAHNVTNTVEEDLRKCLGDYYKAWPPN